MMIFEFAAPNRIIFGKGTINKLGSIIPQMGKNALIVTGSGKVPIESLEKILIEADVQYEIFRTAREPNIKTIELGLALAKSSRCDFVIGFGGGSVLDASKAISALMTNQGELLDYLEVVGKGKEIQNKPAPMIALPTTAGTGTEVTRNAVITSTEHKVKVSMRSPMMVPSVAIVDPVLTYSLPPTVTASTGLDALTQVIEAYTSNKANPITDGFSREGIQRGARFLLKAYRDGQDTVARENMSLTSLLSGLALANSGLGAVHGFAGVMGGMYAVPHGEICACLLSPVMKYNAKTLSKTVGKESIHHRYQEIAFWVTGVPHASIMDGIAWIENLAQELNIPSLRTMGIRREDFPEIIQKTKVSSSMQKNPVVLDDSTLQAILLEAY
jgi:alcohol dehydrogenase class IV